MSGLDIVVRWVDYKSAEPLAELARLVRARDYRYVSFYEDVGTGYAV